MYKITKIRVTGWINIYEDNKPKPVVPSTKAEADYLHERLNNGLNNKRIACVYIDHELSTEEIENEIKSNTK